MRPFRCPESRWPRQLTVTEEDQRVILYDNGESKKKISLILTRTSATSLTLSGGYVEHKASQKKNKFHFGEASKKLKTVATDLSGKMYSLL